MKLVIAGGTGQLGTLLARAFHTNGHEVVVLSRARQQAPWRVVEWDAMSVGPWAGELGEADVVINLAGRSVNCRYTTENRRLITESRVRAARAIGAALAPLHRPPAVWLQMSTATIYAHRYDAPNDERSGIMGGSEPGLPETWRFSIDVAQRWEHAARAFELPHTRLVLMRTAMVMSPDPGGVFDVLLRLVRAGLGGRAGDGRQYVSWIHAVDLVRAVRWLIDHDTLAGPVNLASPHPLPQARFMQVLRRAWGMPIGLPATAWMLELGARLLRTETELILKSRRVTPGRLIETGFEFTFPEWEQAAADLCRQWRNRGDSPSLATFRGR